jgi:translation initiation factor IF-1
MVKGDAIQTPEEIVKNLPNAFFGMKLKNGYVPLGHISGKCGCITSVSFLGTR